MKQWKQWALLALLTLVLAFATAMVQGNTVSHSELETAKKEILKAHNRDFDLLFDQSVRIENKIDEVKDILIEK